MCVCVGLEVLEDRQGNHSMGQLGWDPLRPKGSPGEGGLVERWSSQGLIGEGDASGMGCTRYPDMTNNQRVINIILVL